MNTGRLDWPRKRKKRKKKKKEKRNKIQRDGDRLLSFPLAGAATDGRADRNGTQGVVH